MAASKDSRRFCLLVEDEPLIGLDVEEQVTAAGYAVQWAGSAQSALGYLEASRPDVAIIDLVLRDEQCISLARELRERGIPFVVHSGWTAQTDIPELAGVPWLAKPAEMSVLLAALDSSMRAQPAAC